MQAVLDAVADRLLVGDELAIRIPEICDVTGVNYGSVYHHFGSREGVIDAAYDMIFSRLVEEDLELFERVNDSVETLEEYVTVMAPIVATLSSGPARKKRRAMRIRIVAAAATRPRLKELIGDTQARLTAELRRLTEIAQKNEWLRDDISAEVFAVLFQILIFGRALDDVSREPIDEELWESSMGLLFADLLKH
ncbi:MAG: Transcriptional regulator [Acidimicrobiaceae bacterium]|nr:Transcriptional regulator [Acidimicrobiaceae bacterium]